MNNAFIKKQQCSNASKTALSLCYNLIEYHAYSISVSLLSLPRSLLSGANFQFAV